MFARTWERLQNITDVIDGIDRTNELMSPLAKHLMPLAMERDRADVKIDVIRMRAADWSKQVDAGVNQCMGFLIVWE